MIRNILVVLAGILCGFVVMQPIQSIEHYLVGGRVFHGLGGALFVHLIATVAPAAGAVMTSVVAAALVETARPRLYAIAIAVLVGGLIASTITYVAPDWLVVLSLAVNVLVPAMMAGALFLVFRRVFKPQG